MTDRPAAHAAVAGPRILLLCPERVRAQLAGVGIRFVEMATHLAARQPVTLAIPNAPEEAPALPGVHIVQWSEQSLAPLAAGCAAAVVQGHLANWWFHQDPQIPTVVDLYDPFLVENMHYAAELGYEPFANDHATLTLALARGDFFLCSSAEQRFFYLGFLTALGRVNPDALAEDPALERLVAIAPFGVRREAPVLGPSPPRSASAPVLFFGGVYDWYDPEVLLAALPTIAERFPGVVVRFVGHPNREHTPQARYDALLAAASSASADGGRVEFVPWSSYEERFRQLSGADLAVVTHRHGLETELSLRTRLLDFLRAGLPIVATGGGALGGLLEREGAAVLVPPADAPALAAAIVALLGDAQRRREQARRGEELVLARFAWDRVLAPLAAFCAAPRHDSHKESFLLNREGLRAPTALTRLARHLRAVATPAEPRS